MLEGLIKKLFQDGAFLVRLPDGRLLSVNGASEADGELIVRIRTNRAVRRILANPGLALGEAYMDGDVIMERGALYDLLAVATRNLRYYATAHPARFRRRPRNPRHAAKRNVAHHYDLSGELYRLFLDPDRQYSCAYFPYPGASLEEAQSAKKRHLAAKLLVQPGQRVLDIGSGWGGLALSLAEDESANVLGVTLSEEQLNEARRRAEARGLSRQVQFELCDYRDVAGAFDRIVSVGMFEHVGPAHYQAYFDTMAQRLKDDGIAVLHTIGRYDRPGLGNAWIEKYIFPGGTIPSLSEILPVIEKSGLILTDVEILRLHYAETIKAWRERFYANYAQVRALYDERFCRMWDFYLCGSEAGFREGSLVVFQLQLAKERAVVPLTRDYITDFDRAVRDRGMRIAAE